MVITDGTAWVYNLTVDEAHTYFVGDGQWLVHNCPDQEEFPFLGDIPEIPRQVDYPAIDPNRPLRSSQYTVIYEVQLDSKILHTNMSREEHFQKANEALYWAMHNDRNLYNALEGAYPGLFQAISPNTKTGVFLGESPTGLGLTWHHRPSTNASPEEGIMQLIPRLHHETGGNVQNTLHPLPRRGGGFQQWR